jgi:hypothetical protein
MDIAALALSLTTLLGPFLPYLIHAGEQVAQEAGRKFGSEAWAAAKDLWASLAPKVDAKPAAHEAAHDLAQQPDDQDAQAAFRLQLKKLLAEDESFARKIADQMNTVSAHTIKDSLIVTGNHNVVQQGKYNVSMGNASGVSIGDRARTEVSGPEAKDSDKP